MRIAKSGHGRGGNILWVYASQDGADDCSPFVSRRNRPIYMGSPRVKGYTTIRVVKKQVENIRENDLEGCLVR